MFSTLTAIQYQHWQHLVSLTVPEVWWHDVFARGCFITGSAALFVGDGHQCAERLLHKVDIWAPVSNESIVELIAQLAGMLTYRGLAVAESSVMVYLAQSCILFIRMPSDTTLVNTERIIFDCMQCALCLLPHDAAADNNAELNPPIVALYKTDACARAWLTRYTHLHSHVWPARLPELLAKGFYLIGEDDDDDVVNNSYYVHEPLLEHQCLCTHSTLLPSNSAFDTLEQVRVTLVAFNEQSYHEDLPPPAHLCHSYAVLSAAETQRWELLVSLTGMSAHWWFDMLHRGAFIAGGAALFVGDRHQCVAQLGDIDVWCTFSGSAIELYVRQMLAATPCHILYNGATVTVYLPQIRVQFMRIMPHVTFSDLVKRFDLTYVQCALTSNDDVHSAAPAPPPTLKLFKTAACARDWETRQTQRVPGCVSQTWSLGSNGHTLRAQVRYNKAQRKGFVLRDQAVEVVPVSQHTLPHHCTTQCRPHYQVEPTDARFIDFCALQNMPTIEEAGYTL